MKKVFLYVKKSMVSEVNRYVIKINNEIFDQSNGNKN